MKSGIDWFAENSMENRELCKRILKHYTSRSNMTVEKVKSILIEVYRVDESIKGLSLSRQLRLIDTFYRGGMSREEIIESLQKILTYEKGKEARH